MKLSHLPPVSSVARSRVGPFSRENIDLPPRSSCQVRLPGAHYNIPPVTRRARADENLNVPPRAPDRVPGHCAERRRCEIVRILNKG